MYCPNCGKNSVETSKVDPQEHYYENNYWKRTIHKCNECLASFINFDNGYEARKEKNDQELRDIAEYKRLKAKYGE